MNANVDAFVATVVDRHIAAERSLHSGEVAPRLAMWSHNDPVTLFGAGVTWRAGWSHVSPVFEWIAERFAGCTEYDFEVVTADSSGDLAYLVGIERYTAVTANGETLRNELRTTHVFRREGGEWKVVHRHGDHMPTDRMNPSTD